MIKIKLNDLKYRYDVYQIINLFYDFEEIKFVEEDFNYYVEINLDRIICSDGKHIYEETIKPVLLFKEQVKIIVYNFFMKQKNIELPWGTLIGIRPTKLALELINEGKNVREIEDYYSKHFLVRKDKADLCIEVANWERKTVNKDKKTISIYIGMPFCPTRCVYCSFASNPIGTCNGKVQGYLESLSKEIINMGKYIKENGLKIESIYFGGGTPTSISDDQFEALMSIIFNSLHSDQVKEFTVECGRPDSISENKLLSMKNYLVNRISINPQSMNDDTLKNIGRNHNTMDIIQKFNLARSLGFNNINMDMIVGLPGENYNHIENTVRKIRELMPESVTVHGLCVKRGSRLHEQIINNFKLNKLTQKEMNEMYELTVELSKDLGMHPYYMYRQKNMIGNMENIGYSLPGKEGIYNVQMIEERQTVIAMGADAVTKVVFLEENRIERFANLKDVKEYTQRIDEMIAKKIKLLETLYNN